MIVKNNILGAIKILLLGWYILLFKYIYFFQWPNVSKKIGFFSDKSISKSCIVSTLLWKPYQYKFIPKKSFYHFDGAVEFEMFEDSLFHKQVRSRSNIAIFFIFTSIYSVLYVPYGTDQCIKCVVVKMCSTWRKKSVHWQQPHNIWLHSLKIYNLSISCSWVYYFYF